MKLSTFYHISLFTGFALAALGLTSCLDETFPTDHVTEEQMQQSASSLAGQNNAMAASVMNYGSTYSHAAYPALMMWRDVYCAELPIFTTTYDYFANSTSYLGDGSLFYDWWFQYFNTIHNANVLIGLIPSDTADGNARTYLGNALGYRAWSYLEAAQVWEYKLTGIESLDTQAKENGIVGLTVPIVTEKTTMEEARNNPRVHYAEMYAFIDADLTQAAQLLEGYNRSAVNEMDLSVISALRARLWMLIGSHYEQADDTNRQRLGQAVGISSATEAFEKAAQYARTAISLSGEPTTQSQWFSPTQGFNTAIQSWIFGIKMVPDDNTAASWKSFVAFMSPDADFGVCNLTYEAFRLCDADLYANIAEEDWRKMTWISPDDVGTPESATKYATLLSDDDFARLPELCGLKFHPAAGNTSDYKAGAAVDLPIMRVEEMYYILAEAVARTQGVSAGAQVLTDFTNAYRYTDAVYECTATTMDDFITELLTQKRIEFWGEGIVFWDYKRLCRGVKRNYEGTNHPASYRYNSPDGVVARWMNSYIPSNEYQYNKGIVRNPDPSRVDGMEY